MKLNQLMEAPRKPKTVMPEGLQLIDTLMDEVSSKPYNLIKKCIRPTLVDEAFEEAVHHFTRYMRGNELGNMAFFSMKDALLKAQKATVDVARDLGRLDNDGVFLRHDPVSKTLKDLATSSADIDAASGFINNVYEILRALEFLDRLRRGKAGPAGNTGLEGHNQTFVDAAFQKLGFL